MITVSGLRFREGARVKVLAGPHAGKSGIVERLLLNHLHAYVIQPHEGEAFQAADDQVQAIAGWSPSVGWWPLGVTSGMRRRLKKEKAHALPSLAVNVSMPLPPLKLRPLPCP
ncbi:MAG TPA: KOW motif-containing protein [Methylocella sp.]|nr:KOW motif-containing protein [Methylocella sp.]